MSQGTPSPSSSTVANQYCFSRPPPPFTHPAHLPPQEPPVCVNTTEDHMTLVTNICKSYALCQNVGCKDYYKGRVMCAPPDNLLASCLYNWTQMGINSIKEQEFIKNGTAFAKNNPQTPSDCRKIDQSKSVHI